ncbi:ABC transporter substrate-binding protein [Paracoccus laeviglucosivorans]|uniref:Monosaccharide ABC transporter substrate-binding protein, CUT2 family n=1 Tax=Paracoccus laeviglucosivorans TaxID=1197861 RepID=A0A521EC02_9RHOB|nr:ABC transporter substrate-binding protein [Paracoccus laeviglucosivorans]SMO81409.1 monosaccharide ABC transporter substrate-binding protein, CUT2 family [Paracoccus laeviglucosivorans]
MFTRRGMIGAATALALMTGATGAMAQDKMSVALISKGFQHQFWQAVKQGADKAGADLGVDVTFEGPDNETQVDKQMDMLAAALAKKPSAIALAALDSQAVIPQLKQAQSAGIPVLAFDSGVDSDIPVATASTDNVAAAAMAADKMAELIGGSGQIAVVAHSQTSATGIDRRDGFVNEIKEKYPEIQIVTIEYGDGDHLKSTEITKAILAANPDIKGIFGTNEGSAIGVLNGAREMNSKVVVVGFDSGKAQKDAIRSGAMAGAITQNPVGIGYETVKAAVAVAKGETVAKNIDTGFFWYDKSNIDAPEIAAVLYD